MYNGYSLLDIVSTFLMKMKTNISSESFNSYFITIRLVIYLWIFMKGFICPVVLYYGTVYAISSLCIIRFFCDFKLFLYCKNEYAIVEVPFWKNVFYISDETKNNHFSESFNSYFLMIMLPINVCYISYQLYYMNLKSAQKYLLWGYHSSFIFRISRSFSLLTVLYAYSVSSTDRHSCLALAKPALKNSTFNKSYSKYTRSFHIQFILKV